MDIRKLQRVIVDGLEDVKAQHILVFNTEHLSSLFERVIIASGSSNRQTKSLASSVREAVKEAGFPVPRTEGETNGEWIIVDCGAAVVHVMQPTIRDFYRLEEIWGDKPVRMKIESGLPKLVKAASEGEGEGADAVKPTRRSTRKPAAAPPTTPPPPSAEAWTRGPGPAKSAAGKSAPGRPAPGKPAPGKPAPGRPASAKSASAKSPSLTPATARSPSAKSAPSRKAVAGKSVAAKSPAARKVVVMPGAPVKKAPARKAVPPKVVTRVVGLKKPAAKKGATRSAAPVKKAAGRTFGATTAPRRAAAKKATPGG